MENRDINKDWKKKIIIFLASQTISLFGSSLVQYAIMWHITLKTQSGVMMTIAIVCGFVPTFFLSPFAGVWADRYDRKKLIIFSDALIAISTLVVAILFMIGYDFLWLFFAVSAIRALGTAVHTPTVSAILPQLVPEDQLTKVNALNGSIMSFVMLIAPVLSGALLTMASIQTILFIDVITAAIAIMILILFVKVPTHAKALSEQTLSYFSDMRKGFDYIKEHDFVKNYFVFCAFFFILVAPAAFLTPLQVTRSFGDDVWRLTAIEITFSVGMILGGAIMASWGGFKNRVHTMTLSCLVFGATTVALGVIPVFWLYLLVMAIVGIAMPIFNTPAMVLLQEKVEPDYLGRVFGIFGMITSSMMPLGMLVFGPLADIVRVEWLLIGTGSLLFLQSFFLLGNKALIKAGETA